MTYNEINFTKKLRTIVKVMKELVLKSWNMIFNKHVNGLQPRGPM